MGWRGLAEEPVAAERFAFGQAAAAAAAACRAARCPPLFSLTPCLPFWSSRPYSPPRNPQMLALLRLPHPPVPGLPACRLHLCGPRPPAWPLSQLLCRGGWARFLVVVVCGSSTCPSPPTGMLTALGLAIRRPSPPSPPFAPDRSLSPPFAARAVLHAFIQSIASGHGLCAPSPLMGIASVTSQITEHALPPVSPPHTSLTVTGLAPRHPPLSLPPAVPDRLPAAPRSAALSVGWFHTYIVQS